MQVNNPEILKNTIVVNRVKYNYLIGKGFMLLKRVNSKYYFSKTKELEDALKSIPIWLKAIASISE